MINFTTEIESCLHGLCNTNNKEQNFQGILYHHLLFKYGTEYVIEMETSRDDVHVKGSIIPEYKVEGRDAYLKKEIDLLVYNKHNHNEKYAAELKWIYHRPDSGRWNCLDMLIPFAEDALFVEQLKKYAGFTETCSVVVYDFNEINQVKRIVYGSEEQERRKRAFLGICKDGSATNNKLIVQDEVEHIEKSYPFTWKNGISNLDEGQDNKYYIISF